MHNIKILLFCWKLPSIPPPQGLITWPLVVLLLSFGKWHQRTRIWSHSRKLSFSLSFGKISYVNCVRRQRGKASLSKTPKSSKQWWLISTEDQRHITCSIALCGTWHTRFSGEYAFCHSTSESGRQLVSTYSKRLRTVSQWMTPWPSLGHVPAPATNGCLFDQQKQLSDMKGGQSCEDDCLKLEQLLTLHGLNETHLQLRSR